MTLWKKRPTYCRMLDDFKTSPQRPRRPLVNNNGCLQKKHNILLRENCEKQIFISPTPSVCHQETLARGRKGHDKAFFSPSCGNATTADRVAAAGTSLSSGSSDLKTPFRPLFTQEMSLKTVIQPLTPLSGHEYSHNPLASIPEAPSLRCSVLCGLAKTEGLLIEKKKGELPPPFPLSRPSPC